MTYDNRTDALTGKFEKSNYYQLLNGTWKFFFADSYKDLPANITDPSVSTDSWNDIKVPGNWEVQGYGVAIYTNHGYEFKPRNPQPPSLRKPIRGSLPSGPLIFPRLERTGYLHPPRRSEIRCICIHQRTRSRIQRRFQEPRRISDQQIRETG